MNRRLDAPRTLAAIAATLTAFAWATPVIAAHAVPASCKPDRPCKHAYHYSPDAGYDADILVKCDDDDHAPWTARLREGHDSWEQCPDIVGVYVRTNEQIMTRTHALTHDGLYVHWTNTFDKTGWHTLPKIWSDHDGLVVQHD